MIVTVVASAYRSCLTSNHHPRLFHTAVHRIKAKKHAKTY